MPGMVNVLSSGIWTGVNVDASQFSGLQTKRLAWGAVFEGCSTQVALDGTRAWDAKEPNVAELRASFTPYQGQA
ncbi:hypothetical protein [Streptomyces sp. NPDC051662]|uniref:hypothetical protein n=1 Tax=Streptomyces sp. NPDC051662 TaxID=3154750 RepID=UPI00343E5F05